MNQPDLFSPAPLTFETALSARRFLRLCRDDNWRIVRWAHCADGWIVKAVRVDGHPEPANPRQEGDAVKP